MFDYTLLDKYMVHYVFGGKKDKYVNIHTHFLEDNYGHQDLQLVLPYPTQEASQIMNACVALIDKGRKFEPGHSYSDIFPGINIEFIRATEGQRTVLRMLIPDKELHSPLDPDCSEYCRGQVTHNTSWSHEE